MKLPVNALLIILLAALTSCSPKFYAPNTQNIPLMSEKGEINLMASGNENQIELQASYAIGNHTALMANAGIFIPADLDNGDGGSGKFGEIGAGYFLPVNDHFVFETYGLLGYGSFENHFPSTTSTYPHTKGNISANLFRVGIQPNFGFRSKYFVIAVSARLSNVSYSNITGDLIYEHEHQPTYLRNNSSSLMLEPALTIRGGAPKLKMQAQYISTLNLSREDFKHNLLTFTLGLNYHF